MARTSASVLPSKQASMSCQEANEVCASLVAKTAAAFSRRAGDGPVNASARAPSQPPSSRGPWRSPRVASRAFQRLEIPDSRSANHSIVGEAHWQLRCHGGSRALASLAAGRIAQTRHDSDVYKARAPGPPELEATGRQDATLSADRARPVEARRVIGS